MRQALFIEAETGFSDLIGNRCQFSEFLLNELNDVPSDLPADLLTEWNNVATQSRNYSNKSSLQRQELANRVYKMFHKIPFLQKLYLCRQTGGTSQLDCSGMDLRSVNAQGLHLKGSDFSGADLRKGYFRQAYLVATNFSNANLAGAIFTEAYLNQTVFQGANLDRAIFDGALILDTDFSNATGDFDLPEIGHSEEQLKYEHPQSYGRSGYYSGYDIRLNNSSSWY